MVTFFSPYLLVKVLITATVVVGISELARRHSWLAALLASLPLTSILAFIWMYVDGEPNEAIAKLSYDIFWLVLPSLLFFIVLPLLLRLNVEFLPALLSASAATALVYVLVLSFTGISGGSGSSAP